MLPTGIKIKSYFGGGETQRRCTIIAQLSTLAKTRKAWKRVINPTGTLSLLEQNKQVDSWDWGQTQVAFLVETRPIVCIVSRTQLSALSTNCLQLTYGHWPSGSCGSHCGAQLFTFLLPAGALALTLCFTTFYSSAS